MRSESKSSSLETALTNGTSKTFAIDKDAQVDLLAFLNEAIAPYVEARTKGFALSFGSNEKLEINEERGVFHVIRQGGKEITGEYRLSDTARVEAVETKITQNIMGTMGTLLGARGGDDVPQSADERFL